MATAEASNHVLFAVSADMRIATSLVAELPGDHPTAEAPEASLVAVTTRGVTLADSGEQPRRPRRAAAGENAGDGVA
jgi:hypothetical protein